MILHAACDGKYISPSVRPEIGCDNKGVIHHGKYPRRPLPAKQSQADVLRYYQELVKTCPFKYKFYHVHGHLDLLIPYDELSPAEQVNCDCDALAGEALSRAVESGDFIDTMS